MKSKAKEQFVKGEYLDDDIDNDLDTIESYFKNEQNNNQHEVKELLGEDKVKARTDLSGRQVKLITKGLFLADLTGMKEIKVLLHDFMTISISKDRKSRAEYVEGLKAKIERDINSGMMNVRGQFGK